MAAVTGEQFREVMAHVPSSVTVVAGVVDGRPKGLSVGTFVAVSLDPPLVGFFVARTSKSWPPIADGGAFTVSVLGFDQSDVSAQFAISDTDKFRDIEWRPSPSGHPIVEGAVVWVDCTVEEVLETGDHVLVLGRVLDMRVESGAVPLLHHRSSYRRVADGEHG
jgi:3-hydroxy-9,10-secoandrosta-1,3,5(10)-triene-9,17-dione monooxygenase reductase component